MNEQLELFKEEIESGVKLITITNFTVNPANWIIRPTLDPELFIINRKLSSRSSQECIVEKIGEDTYTVYR